MGPARHRYAWYTGLFASGMMVAIFVLLGLWPFGGGTILTGDLGGIYLNFFSHLKRFFAGEAGFAYGFDKGLGGSLLGLYAYYYSSPYNLLYLLFPLRWFPVAASLVLFAKVVLASVFFNLFICHKFKGLGWGSVALSLCYGFMAWTFVYAQNIMWHDVMVLMPLVCLGIDRIIEGKPFVFYGLALALTIFSNFYIAFMGCLFAALYFVYSMLIRPEKGRWAVPLARFAGGSLLAAGLTAVLMLPALANINRNKGSLLEFEFTLQRAFPLVRLPERLVWGSFDASDVWGELPFIYCGLVVLVLVGCYFISRKLPPKEKLLSGGMLAIFVLSFWIKGLDNVWHGLKAPIWFPVRYSFLFCFFMVLLAAKALHAGAAGKREVLFSGGLLVVALAVMTVFPIAISRKRLLVSEAAILFFTFCLMVAAMTKSPLRKRMAAGVLVVAAAGELVLNAYFITNQFDKYPLDGFQNFVDTVGVSVESIQRLDQSSYRIADSFYANLNDPMLLGYWGMSHFASTQDGYAQGVLYNLGYRNYAAAGPYLMGGTPFADALIGLHYLTSDEARPVPAHWQAAPQLETPLPSYSNPYKMPLLFATVGGGDDGRTGVYEEDLFAFQNDVYGQLGGDGAMFEMQEATLQGPSGPLPLVGSLPVGSRYEMTAPQEGYYYAYFHSPKHLLLPLYVNGEYREIYFSPTYSGVIELGYLEKGQTAMVMWDQTADIQLDEALFARINTEKLAAFADEAWRHSGDFTLKDGRASGTITAEKGYGTLFTAIPWDEDWQATVNGQAVPVGRFAGGLLTVPLQEGENQVELRFVPSGMVAGRVVTGIFVLLFIGGVLLERRHSKKTVNLRDNKEHIMG